MSTAEEPLNKQITKQVELADFIWACGEPTFQTWNAKKLLTLEIIPKGLRSRTLSQLLSKLWIHCVGVDEQR